jgi:hypothetical protein
MQAFEFDVVVTGIDPEEKDFEDRFYRTGCDDATISCHGGEIRISFSRAATDIDAAIASAVGDAERAGAKVVRVYKDADHEVG